MGQPHFTARDSQHLLGSAPQRRRPQLHPLRLLSPALGWVAAPQCLLGSGPPLAHLALIVCSWISKSKNEVKWLVQISTDLRLNMIWSWLRWPSNDKRWKVLTYGIEKNHSFVHNFQKVCHKVKIVIEFLDQLADFGCLYLDDERIGQLYVLCWNDQVVGLWNEHLNLVETIAEVMLTCIQRLLFYYLVHVLWIRLYFVGSWVALNFLIKLASCRTSLLFPYDEIWAFIIVKERVFAYVS